jgi:hypothetical protein
MIQDAILDVALTEVLTYADRVVLCSQIPTSYAEATAAYLLAHKDAPVIGSPEAKAGGGRKIMISGITDGVVDTAGTATHYALVDVSESRLMVARALGANKALVTGSPWTMAAQDLLDLEESV